MRKIIYITVLFASMQIHAASTKEMVSHQVQPNENLFRLSLLYNSTIDDIIHANPGINPARIHIGTTVKIPRDTRMRDAAFVAIFFSPKNAASPSPVTTEPKSATAESIRLSKDAATEPQRPRKSLDDQEKEATIQNNVPVLDNKISIPDPDLSANNAQPNKSNNNIPIANAVANNIPVTKQPEQDKAKSTSEHSLEYESQELQSRYQELMRMASSDPSVQVIDLSKLQMDFMNANKELIQVLNNNDIMSIQIIMKDGSVRNISSPEDKKKIMAQLTGKEAMN